MAIASINPATGEHLKDFSPFDDAEIEKRLSRAEKAFKSYRRTTLTERAEMLHAVSATGPSVSRIAEARPRP